MSDTPTPRTTTAGPAGAAPTFPAPTPSSHDETDALRARIAELEADKAERRPDEVPHTELDDELIAEGQADEPAPDFRVGQVVRRRYFDHYAGAGGEDVEVVGIVTAVEDSGVRVAFLTSSDPVAVDELEEA